MNTVRIPQILLPDAQDYACWAVIACDQFTSNAEYWRTTQSLTRGKLSTYHLILPEIYLNDNPQRRIKEADAAMESYLKSGVFKSVEGGFVLVRRTTQSGTRTGLVISIDLEDYSYLKGAKTPVRSTEATILERIPPRVLIRKNAPIELPHIMLLYDDPSFSVLKSVEEGEKLYDFTLMQGGGKITGTYVKNAIQVAKIFHSLPQKGQKDFLFAVGDGNHSLAAAKTCWDEIKRGLTEEEQKDHPARFALAEAVNIYDPALNFKPIHRLIKTDKEQEFIKNLPACGSGGAQYALGGKLYNFPFPQNIPQGIAILDEYISSHLKKYGGEADYVHSGEEVLSFTRGGGVGVILPPIEKSDFFSLISKQGNLPKKTFSMGDGNEKRYYIEAKAIKKNVR